MSNAVWTNMDARDRIYLIGFMGAGKTTRGKEISTLLGYGFVDIDDLVAEEAGMPIPEIFAKHGEAHFRALEWKVLQRTLILGRTVISTGGGTPEIPGAMHWMNRNGWTAYIKTSEEVLIDRLMKDHRPRPMLGEGRTLDTVEKIQTLFRRREPLYLQSRQILLNH
jgi:shikimate kinase